MMISLSIAGLHSAGDGPWRAGPRAAIGWAAGLGFRNLHLDAAAPGLRPRELDRSARRDLAATLRRNDLGFTGLDLWIPPEHFEDAGTRDRAIGAVSGAIDMAAELGVLCRAAGVVVSVTLPEGLADAPALGERADVAGVFLEDFGPGGAEGEVSAIAIGLDTGRVIMRGEKPTQAFAKAASRLRSLRLNDADDTGRRALGRGRLDLAAMEALHATLTPGLAVVTDLRGLADPAAGAAAALEAWAGA